MNIRLLKIWVNVITIAALVVLIFLSRSQIAEAFRRMADLNYFWLLSVLPLQLANYSAAALFYDSYLKRLGSDVKFKDMLKVSFEMNFVNHVFPSGGVSGFGYFGIRMKQLGVSASKATLTQVMRHALTFLSFILFMIFALVLITFVGDTTRFIVLVSSSVITVILIASALMVYIISSARRVRSFTAFLPRVVNYISRRLLRGKVPRINIERIEDMFEQLHHDYTIMHRDWKKLRMPFFWTIMMNLTELLTILVVYFAFGETVNFGAVIIAYAVASIAGLIAVLPGGVGVYEGLMTAVLTSAGIPRALALSATVVYRVLTTLFSLPLGLIFYQMMLRHKPILAEASKAPTDES